MAISRSATIASNELRLRSEAKTEHRRDTVLILDFGGQYCHLIARAVREQNVYSEIVNPKITAEKVQKLQKDMNIKGIILSGGPQSVYGNDSQSIDPNILNLNIPVLGLCYGHQLIAKLARGDVQLSPKKEFGDTAVVIDKPVDILKGLGRSLNVWMSHSDTVNALPSDYEVIAHSSNTPVAAFRHRTKPIFGLQWHPEVIHTEQGTLMLKNFVIDICKANPEWKMEDFIPSSIEKIREAVGNGRSIVALSGGVDSTVAAALVGRAIDGRLTAVYVDTGLMREGETDEIKKVFEGSGAVPLVINAKERFLQALKGVRSPERKRKIIGREFARIFEEEAIKVKADFLVQGTIYPDRVESGATGQSAIIKTHHNVGGLPKNVKFKAVVEPLRDLYKDEVRKLAAELGLPESIVHRQPFPGPGLAVRIIGPITEEKVDILRQADKIVTGELEASGAAKDLWQYFAVLTDTKAVGVKGDVRAYGNVIAIRAVTGRDAMTARFASLDWELIRRISTRITNEIPSVTRVVYDTTDKPPGTIEWE
jgi:GMP synthase (glutamine-hydrolysing)